VVTTSSPFSMLLSICSCSRCFFCCGRISSTQKIRKIAAIGTSIENGEAAPGAAA
jgi:hypothetical protein